MMTDPSGVGFATPAKKTLSESISGFLVRLTLLWLAVAWVSTATAAGPAVSLVRWAGEGAVIPGRGGGDQIRLSALAAWNRGARVEPGRYALRIATPDGRVETRPFPVETPPGSPRIDVLIPAASVRDLRPDAVKVTLVVVEATSGSPASNALGAGIEQFPRPRGRPGTDDPGPFGWGRPLEGTTRVLPRPGPDGLRFARIVGSDGYPGFFIATAEASNHQVGERLPGYDPKQGRSDEFALDAPDQPVIGLTPDRANQYLKALTQVDRLRLAYRLPTRDEWLIAARGGQSGPFWWGDQPTYPEGANLLGPEPALEADATAPADGGRSPSAYRANPFGLVHTFGNVDEWAATSGGFVRMGGHFRTEPAATPSEVVVQDAATVGPDPFVGVRPAFDLRAEAGADLIRRVLAADPRLSGVAVAFDPDAASATLTGRVAEPAIRRAADQRLGEAIWFLAAVVNRLETPQTPPGRLAKLNVPDRAPRQTGRLGRSFVEVALPVTWSDPLPVSGSSWWVNVYLPGGGHLTHRLAEVEPGRSDRVLVRVERDRWPADGSGASAALSLGAPAPSVADPRIASDVVPLRRPPIAPARATPTR